MKVLLVNTYDYGGAGKACLRLHEGLMNEKVDSKVLILEKKFEHNKAVFQFDKALLNPTYKIFRKEFFKRIFYKHFSKSLTDEEKGEYVSSRDKRLEMFSFADSDFDITKSELYQEADIINLHWTAGFLDYKSFFKKNSKPVVWTLHDMHPFTGGEHYIEKFIGIDNSGFPIDRVLNDRDLKMQRFASNYIKLIFQTNKNIYFVSPSKWLFNKAKKSNLIDSGKIKHIPNGVNSKIFIKKEIKSSRNKFNLPLDKIIILFVANSLNNERKGFKYLQMAINDIDRDDVFLCAIGNNHLKTGTFNNICFVGNIDDEDSMSNLYSAADVFVIPSLMDNLPNTVLESLMCGTPVIGFPVGGITDMIEHGNNGLLSKDISVDALKTSINEFLNEGVKLGSVEIRKSAMEKYSLDIQAKAYKELFLKIKEQKF